MNKRHGQILELLSHHHRLEVSKLSQILNVSQVTIRKDLKILEEAGMLIRVHGFATLSDVADINQRLAFNYESKLKIAQKAAELIQNSETIMIESGSCCALLAMEIAKTKKDITMITNSAFIADYIRKSSQVKVILLGGEYQKESQVMVGPMTKKCVEAFYVDKLFIGTDGYTVETGFTGNDYMRSIAVNDMARQASHVIVVTQSSKFNQKGVVNLLDTSKISTVITDDQIAENMMNHFENININIITTK